MKPIKNVTRGGDGGNGGDGSLGVRPGGSGSSSDGKITGLGSEDGGIEDNGGG